MVKAFLFGFEFIISNTGYFCVGDGAAQRFSIRVFTYGSFYQVGAGEEDGTIVFHHQCFITHNRQISTTRHTGAHYSRYLGYTHGAHAGVVAENTAKMFLVGKNIILQGKEYTGTVYQVNNGQMIIHGNFLQSKILFASYRKPGAGLYRLVIGNDYTLPTAYITNTRYGASSRTSALFFVHLKTGKGTQLQEGPIAVCEVFDTFSRAEFLPLMLSGQCFFTTAFGYFFEQLPAMTDGQLHGIFITVEFNIHSADRCLAKIGE